jgi:amino-acid N-acetyltransferase
MLRQYHRFRLLLKTKGAFASSRPFFKHFMNSIGEYKLVVAEAGLRAAALALLRENDLPVSDLDETKTLFACLSNGDVIGTGGMECFRDCALLRSISIKKDLQNKGLGRFIVGELERLAEQTGINCLYLLTTTAGDFFTKIGYETIDREAVPIEIKNTTEFFSVCPSSAIVMRKILS